MLNSTAPNASISNITLVPAAQLSAKHLARLINQTFADYFLTIWLDEHQLERMCYEEDVDLMKSVVAMVNDVPVGITLLSIRDTQGWISGVGVLPLWRRRGVAAWRGASRGRSQTADRVGRRSARGRAR